MFFLFYSNTEKVVTHFRLGVQNVYKVFTYNWWNSQVLTGLGTKVGTKEIALQRLKFYVTTFCNASLLRLMVQGINYH